MADENVTGGSIGFGFNEGSGKSTTDPWAKQIPYLTGGFEQAQQLLNRGSYGGPWFADPNSMQRNAISGGYGGTDEAQGVAAQLRGFGGQLGQGFNPAMQFYNQALQGGMGISNPYAGDQYQNIIRDNSWTGIDQDQLDLAQGAIADQRAMSDRGTRLGASMSGVAGGSDSLRGYAENALGADRLAGDVANQIARSGQDRATGMANQWAGQNVAGQMADNQFQSGAAGSMANLGAQGANYLQNAYGMGQQGYRDAAGWGDYQRDFDQEQIGADKAQFEDPWNNLARYWNVVGGSNWGGTTETESKSTSASGKFGF